MRNILSVVLGYAAWSAVFLGGSSLVRSAMASAHDEAGFTTSVVPLLIYLVISAIASLLAGFATARIAISTKTRWVWITAIALLATGIPVQLSAWDQIPVWYNVLFLALLVPVTVLGGTLGGAADPQE